VPVYGDRIIIFVLVFAPGCRGSVGRRGGMSDRRKYMLMSIDCQDMESFVSTTHTPVLRVFRAVQRWPLARGFQPISHTTSSSIQVNAPRVQAPGSGFDSLYNYRRNRKHTILGTVEANPSLAQCGQQTRYEKRASQTSINK